MNITSKLLLPLILISLNSHLLFAQRMAAVEDRSISLDAMPANTNSPSNANPNFSAPANNQNNTSFQEYDTPVQNPNEVPNIVTQPVYDPSVNNLQNNNQINNRRSAALPRVQQYTQVTQENQYSNQSTEEIRSLEQEIERDNNPANTKRRLQDLQSLSSDSRIQRLENINEQQQSLKLEKKIRLLQLQVQNLTGLLEAQQHKLEQAQSQDRLLHENFERRLAEYKSAAATQPQTQIVTPDVASGQADQSSASGAKGFDGPIKAAAAPTEVKKSYTLKDNDAEQQVLYNAAYEQIKSRKYDMAIEKLNQYVTKYPSGQFNEGAHYWLGEIYMLQSKYDKALTSFDQVLTKYPKGQKSPDALYKKGLVYLYKKDFKLARATLSSVTKKYANSAAAGLAQKQLKTLETLNNAA